MSTCCQEMNNHLTRKVGIEGTPKLGPYWKSQPASCKVNMVTKDHSHLWVRFSRGFKMLVTELGIFAKMFVEPFVRAC